VDEKGEERVTVGQGANGQDQTESNFTGEGCQHGHAQGETQHDADHAETSTNEQVARMTEYENEDQVSVRPFHSSLGLAPSF
jgi:hypothetical protein